MVRYLHSHREPTHRKKKRRLRDRNFFSEEGEDLGEKAPQNVLGISDRELTKMFEKAWEMVEYHEAADAVRAFTLLCYIHPYISDSWYGLALSFRENELYEEAVSALSWQEQLKLNALRFIKRPSSAATFLETKKRQSTSFIVCTAIAAISMVLKRWGTRFPICRSFSIHKKRKISEKYEV